MDEQQQHQQTIETRIALLEDFKTRTLEHHKEMRDKLDAILKKLDDRQCTVHAARMLQLDQDLKDLKREHEGMTLEFHQECKDMKKEIMSVQIKLAMWTGAVGVITFIATKMFK
jgi:hypothetical protein